MKECVLVADDDREIVAAIAILLEKEGYEVLKAYDGLQALALAAENRVQLLIVDVMMPKMDGLSAVMKLREKRNIPIIVLSAKSEDSDKILGLSIGADDYVTKPFHPQELAARVRSQLRRYNSLGDARSAGERNLIRTGRLSYHTEERCLYADGEPVRLTATETGIVDCLCAIWAVFFRQRKSIAAYGRGRRTPLKIQSWYIFAASEKRSKSIRKSLNT